MCWHDDSRLYSIPDDRNEAPEADHDLGSPHSERAPAPCRESDMVDRTYSLPRSAKIMGCAGPRSSDLQQQRHQQDSLRYIREPRHRELG